MIYDGRISNSAFKKAQNISVVLMDVDGVLTSGMIVYDSNGLEIKHFNAHDGLGIKLARLGGLKTGIISARESGTIRKRANEIKMDYLYLGKEKKLPSFLELQENLKLTPDKFCFIGDDLPDIPVMKNAGLAVAVRNATDIVKKNADYITLKTGGDGAVREVIEIILDAKGLLETAIKRVWDLDSGENAWLNDVQL